MRVADRTPIPTNTPVSRACKIDGCELTTREGKPFCPEHIDETPYVRALLESIADRNAEDEKVRKREIDPEDYNLCGITAQSILQQLRNYGTRTRVRICRELMLDKKTLDGYADALARADLVVLGSTHRGCETLSLRPA